MWPPLFIYTVLPLPPHCFCCICFCRPFLLFSSFVVLLAASHFFPPNTPLSLSCPPSLCQSFLSFPSSPPLLSPSVPIRRNLIGNQSFWWKNGVGLSITVPWVLPAERGVQKRLYTGTVEGKVNAADSLSLALFSLSLYPFVLSQKHTLSISLFFLFSSLCFLQPFSPPTHTLTETQTHSQRVNSIAGELSCPWSYGV